MSNYEPHLPLWNEVQASVEEIISTVQNTGGLIRFRDGHLAPAADPDWIDLGEAIFNLAQLLNIDIEVHNEEGDEAEEDDGQPDLLTEQQDFAKDDDLSNMEGTEIL